MLSFAKLSTAQTAICGTDEYRKAQLQANPHLAQLEKEQKYLLYNHLISRDESSTNRSTVFVPVVVHVLHQGGPENISNSTVINAINELNLRFQNAAPFFDLTGNTVEIQFCLASVDPWGNATNGITHDYSPTIYVADYQNFQADFALKSINRWNPWVYLNIWTVAGINGGAYLGYATFPGGEEFGTDGVVVKYTEMSNSTSILAHEVGHYFGLYHTFEGSCTNYNCLLDGDQVCDTPPDVSLFGPCPDNSCSTEMSDTSGFNPFVSDVNELPNYMDYTYCPLSFSQGQADRMETTLSLLRPTLIASNGCGANPNGTVPVAAFTVDSSACRGTGEYTFTSTSTNSQYTAWDFENDGWIDAVGETVTHTYSASGNYVVKMLASGFGGSDTVSQSIVDVFVAPYPTYPILASYPGTTIDPILGTPYACKGDLIQLSGEAGMISYQWSTSETTPTIDFTIDSTVSIYLTTTNAQGETFTNCEAVVLSVNPPLVPTIVTGADTSDCGELLTIRLLPNPHWFPASNTWYRNGQWFSANQFVLSNYGIPPGSHSVWIENNVDPIGCITNTDTLNFFINDPIPPTIVWNGTTITMNYECLSTSWFKDGVQLAASDSSLVITENGCYFATCVTCQYLYTDTICISDLGVSATSFGEQVSLHPNPFSTAITISFSQFQHNTSVVLLDLMGREARSIQFSGESLLIERGNLSKGMYVLSIKNAAGEVATEMIQIE